MTGQDFIGHLLGAPRSIGDGSLVRDRLTNRTGRITRGPRRASSGMAWVLFDGTPRPVLINRMFLAKEVNMISHPNRSDRVGRRVEIKGGGMAEFHGRTGTIVAKEGDLFRVRFDEPVEIEGLGPVRDDLWEGQYLRTIRG